MAKQANPLAWMPVYLDELLALPLAPEELGGYLRLAAYAWTQDPPCTLPDDDRRLAIISGLGARWGEAGDAIRELLEADPANPGRLVDRKLLARWQKQIANYMARALAGRKGGEAKSANRKQPASLASILPPVSQLISQPFVSVPGSTTGTENLDKRLATGQQTGSSASGPDPEPFDPERELYDAQLRDAVQEWSHAHPDEAIAVEQAARQELGIPMGRAVGRVFQGALADKIAERVRATLNLPTFAQWQAGERPPPLAVSA